MPPARRRALLLAPLAAPAALAQGQQPRPVRVVVPFAAGGIIDLAARVLAEPMSRQLGQAVVVENVPGAGATIGARAVARAAPDGQTLMVSGAAHPVMAALYPDSGLDPLANFAPVTLISQQPFVLALHPSVPARDVPGFLAWLRGRGGQATFATTGIGSASHLASELLKKLAGVGFTTVTYRGTPQAVTDLTAGRVDFMLDTPALLAPLAREGRVAALAVTTAVRSPFLPELPPLAEALPGFESSSWQAMHAPAGVPAPVLARIAAAATAALAEEGTRRRLSETGLQPMAPGPGALAAFLRAETERWVPILRAAGARGGG